MMRSIWKGHIRFSLVTIPVRVYNAVDTAETIHFNQLHRDCNGPIGYDKRCKKCNQVVSSQDILKGYQYEPEQYVVIEPEDLEKVKLKSTKVIEIEGFVNSAEISPALYEAPYFIGPDGEVAAKAYALLREALRETQSLGIGKVVLRDREDVVSVAAYDEGLMLYKLRYPKELRSTKDVPQLDDVQKVDPEQLKLALSLVDTMRTTLDKIEIRDRYNEALREIIEAKVQGKEIVTVMQEERPVLDIMTALKESISQAKQQRQPMIKATGKAKAEKEKPLQEKPSKGRKRA
jgi:DNA end-binding protein Ku